MIGIDLDNKVFCRNCNEYFIKGTGHLLFCADCEANGRDSRHPICDICHKDLLARGVIKNITYNRGELSDILKEKLK